MVHQVPQATPTPRWRGSPQVRITKAIVGQQGQEAVLSFQGNRFPLGRVGCGQKGEEREGE